MRLVLLGPPGAGKGTQAHRLADQFGVALIATGDIFRANLRDRTPLGLEAQRYMDAGDLVPDDVVVKMVLARLDEPDAQDGFILDGFPRTLPQAEALEKALADSGRPLSAALKFVIPDDLSIARLLGRRTCAACQRTYPVDDSCTRVPGVCDYCGGELVHRSDDGEATVRHRLEVYHRDTEPLELYFVERGLLHTVDAVGELDEVTERAVEAIEENGFARRDEAPEPV
jgi:adenylate kinase